MWSSGQDGGVRFASSQNQKKGTTKLKKKIKIN